MCINQAFTNQTMPGSKIISLLIFLSKKNSNPNVGKISDLTNGKISWCFIRIVMEPITTFIPEKACKLFKFCHRNPAAY
jgi:hypothetical protein